MGSCLAPGWRVLRGEKTLGCCDRALHGASYPKSGGGGTSGWFLLSQNFPPTRKQAGTEVVMVQVYVLQWRERDEAFFLWKVLDKSDFPLVK